MRRWLWVILGLVLLTAACITNRIGRRVVPGELADGWWEGEASSFPNSALVLVAVQAGRIVDVELVAHGGSWIGHRANRAIPTRMVEQQSTAVDAVTGATNSSHVIMNAAEAALEKSRAAAAQPPNSQPTVSPRLKSP